MLVNCRSHDPVAECSTIAVESSTSLGIEATVLLIAFSTAERIVSAFRIDTPDIFHSIADDRRRILKATPPW